MAGEGVKVRIYTRLEYQWNGHEYALISSHGFDYTGPVQLACGASSGLKDVGNTQSNFYNQVSQQAGQVFGNASQVFQTLFSSFAPTVEAGPNQQGFSPTELSALNSQAVTQTGQAYKNAKQALGENQAAFGGGNTPLPSGAQIGENANLASASAEQSANSLLNVQLQNYATGRANYLNAVQGLANAPSVFNASTNLANAATGAGSAAANTQNQISQANNSWMNLVGGALGGVTGALTGGLMGGGMSSLFGGGGGGGAQSAAGWDPVGQATSYAGGAPFTPFNAVDPLGSQSANLGVFQNSSANSPSENGVW